ncbi:MAG: methyltransferase domain-containing protein [Hyphomicrobiaceae bacterium]
MNEALDAATLKTAEAAVAHGGFQCRLCGGRSGGPFVNLGMSPLCESFLAHDQLDAMEPYYPLYADVCADCHLVQLRQYVTPEHIFEEYAYFSSYSTSWVAHARAYCRMITTRLGLDATSRVVELASNDGYLLQHFKELGVPALGIEPAANVARRAIEKGIETRVAFFGRALASQMIAANERADLVIGNNVLAQVPDLNDFVAGIKMILKPDGVATLEFPHLLRLMDENQFDTIYHEHFSYFSLITIARMAAQHGLRLFDVEQLATHGGSLRVYLCQPGAVHPTAARVAALIDEEIARGLEDLATYAAFGARVAETKRRLLAFLIQAKDAGKRIVGYGAPGKGNTLLNYCGIGVDFLDFTVDRNPYKHGRFTPGMHIPIHPVEALDQARPDYVLILPWNLKDEIVQQMRHIGEWGGRFVVPIPSVHLIDPREAVS